MFEPDIFAQQVFPHHFIRLLKVAGGLAMRVILLPILVFAVLNLPGAASERPPILPNEDHPTSDRLVMVAMFDEADSKWKVSELTGPEPMSFQKFGEQNIWIFYGVKPSTPRKGALSVKTSRLFKGEQSPLQTDYSLQYETTALGSWIPFYIGTGGSYSSLLQQITIVMTDLGANDTGAEVKRILVIK